MPPESKSKFGVIVKKISERRLIEKNVCGVCGVCDVFMCGVCVRVRVVWCVCVCGLYVVWV